MGCRCRPLCWLFGVLRASLLGRIGSAAVAAVGTGASMQPEAVAGSSALAVRMPGSAGDSMDKAAALLGGLGCTCFGMPRLVPVLEPVPSVVAVQHVDWLGSQGTCACLRRGCWQLAGLAQPVPAALVAVKAPLLVAVAEHQEQESGWSSSGSSKAGMVQ